VFHRRVPLDEAAPAYKSSEEVIRAVVEAGLAEIKYTLWPLASLKGVDERKSARRNKPKDNIKEKRTTRHF